MENEEQLTERNEFTKTKSGNEYQELRSTGLRHDPQSNIYYKGMSVDKVENIFFEGIIGEFYLRHAKRVIYITKDKKTAEKYAEEKNGVVVVIDGKNLNIEPSGHSNQFIVNDYIPKENIINIYRVENIKDNSTMGKRGRVESWEERQKIKEERERSMGVQTGLGGY